jgi:hypothetical protein
MEDSGDLPAQNASGELSEQCSPSEHSIITTAHYYISMTSYVYSDEQRQEAAARIIQSLAVEGDPATVPARLEALTELMNRADPPMQVAAASALNRLACGSEYNQRAIASDPACLDALIPLLHSQSTIVLRAALETVKTLAEGSCKPARAAICSMLGYLTTLLSLLHPTRLDHLGSIQQGAVDDVMRLVQLHVLHHPRRAAAELVRYKGFNLLTVLLNAPDAGVRHVARAVRSCLVTLDYHGVIPVAAVPHCIDALVAVLNSTASSSSSSASSTNSSSKQQAAAAALHVLACKDYSYRNEAAEIVPQFLEKMMCALRSEVQAVQTAALDAVQCLTKNQYTDHFMIQHSHSLLYLLPMLLTDNDSWRYAAASALCSLAEMGPETCEAIMQARMPPGNLENCVDGLYRLIGGDRPPHLKAAAARTLGVLAAGSRERQDKLLAKDGCVYRLVALLDSTDQAVQLAGLGALASLGAGNNRAVIMIKSQQGVDYAGNLWRMQCSGPGPLRTAACLAERSIRYRRSDPPKKSASWQESLSKALQKFARCTACQESCLSTREASYAALCA